MPRANLILIGLRGSGKTTIGRLVAARLAVAFVDLDLLTPWELGFGSVREAWERAGETGFRRGEAAALTKVLTNEGQVIALGGGTPTAPGAETMLREVRRLGEGVIVYLRAPAAVLRERLKTTDNTHRPVLTPGAQDAMEEMDEVLARRDPLYAALAEHVVETEGMTAEELADQVVELFQGRDKE